MNTPPDVDAQRFTLIDALRGFAVFGIFGTNMVAASLNWGKYDQPYFGLGQWDKTFEWLVSALVEGKFYSIFSLLFGIGFGLQLSRHHSAGRDGLPLFKRRLWGLVGIGIFHLLFVWVGDILLLYAWLGFVLIAFRNRSDQWLLKAAFICLLTSVLLYPLRFIHPYVHLGTPIGAIVYGLAPVLGFDLQTFDPLSAFGGPGWLRYFKVNIIALFFRQSDLFDQVRPFKVFAMFLLGLWVSRHAWYQYPERFMAFARPYVKWVLPIVVLINVAMALISWDRYYAGSLLGWLKTLLYFLGVVPLSLCYVYFFCKAWLSGKYKWLNGFTYVGRMALTNYLLHSLLYMVLFRGPFLALAGQVGLLALMVPVLVFFPLQVVASRWWLQHYRYGPAEWLWRSFTYKSWQPIKR